METVGKAYDMQVDIFLPYRYTEYLHVNFLT